MIQLYSNRIRNFVGRSLVLVLPAIAVFAMLMFAGCGDTSSKNGTTRLVLTGSSTVAPLASDMGKAFEALHPEVRVDVQTGGSSRGVHDAQQGLADIGMASRSLKPSEKGLTVVTIAHDGVAMIVHADNPIKELTSQQIIDIFTGKITNWKSLNGIDAPITTVHKAEGHSTLELFLHYFKLKNEQVKPSVIIGDNEQGIKMVAGNPNAIGYVSIGAAEYAIVNKTPLKILPLEGVEASSEMVTFHRYPFVRPLNLLTKGAAQGWAKKFIDFALSPESDHIIHEHYFVPAH